MIINKGSLESAFVVHSHVCEKSYLCPMHFISEVRYNPNLQCDDKYYRIKESFRDLTGRVRCRIMLNVGFMTPRLSPEEVRDIAACLTHMSEHQGEQDLFGGTLSRYNEAVKSRAKEYWIKMVELGKIDSVRKSVDESRYKAARLVDVNTVKHTDARDVGAEWICLQAIRELEIDRFLAQKGWTEIKVNTAVAHLITRTVYTPSELKSMRIMADNSAVCELVSGSRDWRPGFSDVYKVAPSLYELKDELEDHLCRRTDNLFNVTNRLVLFDLTNFYFEGRKDGSVKAMFSRSKEKRSDCKLLVLALCINAEGFIRYSSILAGNTSDPDSLPNMIETLSSKTRVPAASGNRKTLVVVDAGIATEENLDRIKSMGYNYLCVSRRRLTDYELSDGMKTVTVLDSKRQAISLREVRREEGGDYYLEVNSPGKALKESSMNRKFRERFELELAKTRDSLGKPRGKKNYEKVIERVGRAIGKYPSIAKYYVIEYERDENRKENMKGIRWRIAVPENVDKDNGMYFLRTNVDKIDEEATWDYYNLIREIECTNRQLKTDLNLRPIYHQKDKASDAHLFLGLLSYWIVNTIRHKLKEKGETCYWTEIVRRMSTQKAITTEATNVMGERVIMRLCSEPTKVAEDIYDKLGYKKMPFRKMRLCSTQ